MSGVVRLGQVLFLSSPLSIIHRVGCPDSAFVEAAGVNQQPPVQDEAVQAVLGMNPNTTK
jgi:hypothetical protein